MANTVVINGQKFEVEDNQNIVVVNGELLEGEELEAFLEDFEPPKVDVNVPDIDFDFDFG